MKQKQVIASLFRVWRKKGVDELNKFIVANNGYLMWAVNDPNVSLKEIKEIKHRISLLNYIKKGLLK